MIRPLGLLLLAAFSADPLYAASLGKYAFCQGNPELNQVGFAVTFMPEDRGPAKVWNFKFHHCSMMGRPSAPPFEIQRYYEDGAGRGLAVTTQMGSIVSTVRLISMDGKPHENADLGPYFTSALLSGSRNDFYPAFLYSNSEYSGKSIRGTIKIDTLWE